RAQNNLAPDKGRQQPEDMRALEKALTEVLRAEQQQRVQQLLLQQRGTAALTDATVSQMLKLTAAQAEQLTALQGELRRVTRAAVYNRIDTGKDGRERVLKVLTPEQQAKWKELTGEPFQGLPVPGIFINQTGNS